jgi:hypothetical protein
MILVGGRRRSLWGLPVLLAVACRWSASQFRSYSVYFRNVPNSGSHLCVDPVYPVLVALLTFTYN